MPKLTQSEINKTFGLSDDKPEGDTADTPRAAAVNATEGLDEALAGLVEKHRQPHESHAQAADRLMRENPGIYEAHMRAKNQVLKRHGIGDRTQGIFVLR